MPSMIFIYVFISHLYQIRKAFTNVMCCGCVLDATCTTFSEWLLVSIYEAMQIVKKNLGDICVSLNNQVNSAYFTVITYNSCNCFIFLYWKKWKVFRVMNQSNDVLIVSLWLWLISHIPRPIFVNVIEFNDFLQSIKNTILKNNTLWTSYRGTIQQIWYLIKQRKHTLKSYRDRSRNEKAPNPEFYCVLKATTSNLTLLVKGAIYNTSKMF